MGLNRKSENEIGKKNKSAFILPEKQRRNRKKRMKTISLALI
jgi:hypothetical protein